MGKIDMYIGLYKSMFYKRDKHIWIFGAWFGNKYGDNSKYLFMQAAKREDIRAVWVSNNQTVVDELTAKGYEAYTMNSPESIELHKKAKYIFMCTGVEDFYYPVAGNATFINLWHGVPLKKVAYADKITNKKKSFKERGYIGALLRKLPYRKQYMVTTSKTMQDIYLPTFRTKRNHTPILGQPRNDVFFDPSLGKDLHSELAGDKKIILYMPTHRNEGSTPMDCNKILDLQAIEEFCKKNGFVFLIKKHYYHAGEDDGISRYECIKDITQQSFDSQELILTADIMITDYSSCYIDYLLLDRPVIFYNYDYENYLVNDREMYFDYEDVTPGHKVSKFEDLMGVLKGIVEEGKDECAAERKRVCDLFYDKDCQGMVGPKIIDYVLELDR